MIGQRTKTRREILHDFAAAPGVILDIVVFMVGTFTLMLFASFPLLFLLLMPAEILLIVSPLVGLVSPPAGRWCASWMEPALHAWMYPVERWFDLVDRWGIM